MSIIISNAFSLQMLNLDVDNDIQICHVRIEDVKAFLADNNNNFVSAIGHVDTANVVSSILGVPVPMNRINVKLTQNDSLIVAQIVGGRLPEGATTLPEGFKIKFVEVQLTA